MHLYVQCSKQALDSRFWGQQGPGPKSSAGPLLETLLLTEIVLDSFSSCFFFLDEKDLLNCFLTCGGLSWLPKAWGPRPWSPCPPLKSPLYILSSAATLRSRMTIFFSLDFYCQQVLLTARWRERWGGAKHGRGSFKLEPPAHQTDALITMPKYASIIIDPFVIKIKVIWISFREF